MDRQRGTGIATGYWACDRVPSGDPEIVTPGGSGLAATRNPALCAAACNRLTSEKLSG